MESIVFYVFIFVLSLIVILAILSNGNNNPNDDGESLIKTVVIEGLEDKDKDKYEDEEDKDKDKDKTMPRLEDAFCDSSSANSSLGDIDKKCQTLSDKNCSLVNCCVFLNGEKCVGGTSAGPTYLSVNGENVDVRYYRHKTKVYKLQKN